MFSLLLCWFDLERRLIVDGERSWACLKSNWTILFQHDIARPVGPFYRFVCLKDKTTDRLTASCAYLARLLRGNEGSGTEAQQHEGGEHEQDATGMESQHPDLESQERRRVEPRAHALSYRIFQVKDKIASALKDGWNYVRQPFCGRLEAEIENQERRQGGHPTTPPSVEMQLTKTTQVGGTASLPIPEPSGGEDTRDSRSSRSSSRRRRSRRSRSRALSPGGDGEVSTHGEIYIY